MPPEVLGSPEQDTRGPGPGTCQTHGHPRLLLQNSRRSEALNEAKLILVGYGDVGKTSLVNRWFMTGFDEAEKKTEGINIAQWPVSLPTGGCPLARLGLRRPGDHARHAPVLPDPAQLVPAGAERPSGHEDADADYWLSLIDSFGEGSPVLVVLNKIKEHPFDLNRRGLMQKFGIVRGFIETDCEGQDGHRGVEDGIIRETDRLEHLRDAFPASWFGIKDRLAGMEANYISMTSTGRSAARTARRRRRSGGAGILSAQPGHRPELQGRSPLADTHVLNPHWVTEGIYRILNAEDLARRKGRASGRCSPGRAGPRRLSARAPRLSSGADAQVRAVLHLSPTIRGDT